MSFTESGGGLQKALPVEPATENTRGVVVYTNNKGYRVEFGGLELQNSAGAIQSIPLAVLPDTIPVSSFSNVVPYLQSQPFTADANSSLYLHLDSYPMSDSVSLGNTDLAYKLDFVNQTNNAVLYSMDIAKLSANADTRI